MSVQIALSRSAFGSMFSQPRFADAAALAAGCGRDVVRLQPQWPAVIAMTRFAEHSSWRFGNPVALAECLEAGTRRWLDARRGDDPLHLHFHLARWGSVYARSTRGGREIDIFADDDSAIAAVRLENPDASLDELIWLLADDAPAPARMAKRTPLHVSRPFAAGSLCNVFAAAFEADLPVHIRLENAGGFVDWSLRGAVIVERDGCVELRSHAGRLTVCDHRGGLWSVFNAGTSPVLDARGPNNIRWVTISLSTDASLEQTETWREICSFLTYR